MQTAVNKVHARAELLHIDVVVAEVTILLGVLQVAAKMAFFYLDAAENRVREQLYISRRHSRRTTFPSAEKQRARRGLGQGPSHTGEGEDAKSE